MAGRRTPRRAATYAPPGTFRRITAGRSGLNALSLAADEASVSLGLRSERPRELTLAFGRVRRRAATGRTVRSRAAQVGGLRIEVAGSPPGLVVRRGGEVVFETATELPPGKLPGPGPWGVRGGGVSLPIRFAPGERLYGGGEFFGPLDRTGQELRTSVRDVFGLPNEGTYVTYPFFWSTRGYALLVESWAPVRLDFGRQYLGLGEVEIPNSPVVVRLYFSRDPREILRWFWARRGPPAVPPLWSYGVWYSRCAYRDQRELLSVARRIRRLGLPGDVIHLDPPWLDQPLPDALYAAGRRLGFSRAGVDRSAERDPGDVLAGLQRAAGRRGEYLPFFGVGCTFRWNHRRFPDPSAMIRELHAAGLRLSLWVNPYVPAHTPEFQELRRRGLFVRRGDGTVGVQLDGPSVDFGAVDFSHPAGRRWYADRIAELVRLGVDVIKTDFGEGIPDDGRGATVGPPELHNRYATLYPETVFRAVERAGGDPMVWCRPGGLDIHRYPIQWGGDPRTFPRDMAAALRGALSYAASGGAFTSFDSGGFGGRPDGELYVRWMQAGMLFSHTRLHGTTPREPWAFGREALRIFRRFAKLRYQLAPYLYSQSVEGVRLGRPLVRPLVVDFPDDPSSRADDEYLLGEDLLIAPVIPGGRGAIDLPHGRWYDFDTGRAVAATPSRRGVPLDRLPMFVRDGGVIATTARDHDRLTPSVLHDLVLRTYGIVRSATFDFGPHGRLNIPDLRRPTGRSGRFRWSVRRVGRST